MRHTLNTTDRYGWLSMGLHWLMLLLIMGVFACIWLTGVVAEGSDTEAWLKTWHFNLGLTVFALVGIRLIAKLISPTPVIEPPLAHWQDVSAKAVQALLYALMFAMPLLGWLTLSARGKSIAFYGWQLPSLIAQSKNLAETIKDIHEFGAASILALVGVHAAASLYHHFFLRDNTLQRMLP